MKNASSGRNTILFSIASFVLPFLVIVFFNWSVYKTAKRQINALKIQIGSLAATDNQQQQMSKRTKERKAAVDIGIVICGFLLRFLPGYVVGFVRKLAKSIKVPGEAVLVRSCIFHASSICNPIIYSIRKRDLRTGVKNMFRRIGLCRSSYDIDNNMIAMNSLIFGANLTTDPTSTHTVAQATQYHDGRSVEITRRTRVNFHRCLSPI